MICVRLMCNCRGQQHPSRKSTQRLCFSRRFDRSGSSSASNRSNSLRTGRTGIGEAWSSFFEHPTLVYSKPSVSGFSIEMRLFLLKRRISRHPKTPTCGGDVGDLHHSVVDRNETPQKVQVTTNEDHRIDLLVSPETTPFGRRIHDVYHCLRENGSVSYWEAIGPSFCFVFPAPASCRRPPRSSYCDGV